MYLKLHVRTHVSDMYSYRQAADELSRMVCTLAEVPCSCMMFLQRPAKSLEDASRQADESEAELLRQWELASMRGEEVRSALPLPSGHPCCGLWDLSSTGSISGPSGLAFLFASKVSPLQV